jgi:hypothetical protein
LPRTYERGVPRAFPDRDQGLDRVEDSLDLGVIVRASRDRPGVGLVCDSDLCALGYQVLLNDVS